MTICKFPLKVDDVQRLSMPAGARPLSVQTLDADFEPCLWALVDPEKPSVAVTIFMYGTGHPVPADRKQRFIDTFQVRGGSLIFHVFVEE